MDLKECYDEVAQEIASDRYGVGFYGLDDDTQIGILLEAEVWVNEKLMEQAERRYDETIKSI